MNTEALRKLRPTAFFLGALAVFSIWWHPVLLAPDAHLFNSDGDGLKNYFTVAWHVKHDTSAFQFSGMNHPFGEQVDMIDGQPALSIALRAVSSIVPGVENHTVAWVNLLVLFGFAWAAVLYASCLTMLGVERRSALLLGLGMGLLAPQCMRTVMAHYSLATPWVMPLMVWLLLRMQRAKRPAHWAAAIGIVLFLLFRHHAYVALIVTAWIGIRWVIGLLRKADATWRWPLLVALLVPLLLHGALVAITDHHTDRTAHPTGFEAYRMAWDGLLRPDAPVASPLVQATIGATSLEQGESMAYLGLGLMFLAVVVVPLLIVAQWRARRGIVAAHSLSPLAPQEAVWLFLSTLPLALFAFGRPFFPDHLDVLWQLPMLRQLRAAGRFIWPTWCMSGLLLPVAVTAAGRMLPRRYTHLLLLPAATLLLYEGAYYQSSLAQRCSERANVLRQEHLPEELRHLVEAVPAGTYRALLPLPFYHNGAEELMLPVDGVSLFTSQVLAYHTGLPLLSSNLGRTSLTETRALIGLLGAERYATPLQSHFRPEERFLVLWTGAELPAEDQGILDRSRTVVQSGNLRLSEITSSELFRDRRSELLQQAMADSSALLPMGDLRVSRANTVVTTNGFEDRGGATHVYRGAGALTAMRKDHTVLAEFPEGRLDTGITYIASFWLYNRGPMRTHLFIGVDDHDPTTGRSDWTYYTDGRFCRLIDGDWSFVQLPFRSNGTDHRQALFITSWPAVNDTLWVDELLVRPKDLRVQRWPAAGATEREVMVDGQFLPLSNRE